MKKLSVKKTGGMTNPNKTVTVSTTPTKYTGGKSTAPKGAATSATPYKGGKQTPPAGAVPASKMGGAKKMKMGGAKKMKKSC